MTLKQFGIEEKNVGMQKMNEDQDLVRVEPWQENE